LTPQQRAAIDRVFAADRSRRAAIEQREREARRHYQEHLAAVKAARAAAVTAAQQPIALDLTKHGGTAGEIAGPSAAQIANLRRQLLSVLGAKHANLPAALGALRSLDMAMRADQMLVIISDLTGDSPSRSELVGLPTSAKVEFIRWFLGEVLPREAILTNPTD
jgi:hypothetical protein